MDKGLSKFAELRSGNMQFNKAALQEAARIAIEVSLKVQKGEQG